MPVGSIGNTRALWMIVMSLLGLTRVAAGYFVAEPTLIYLPVNNQKLKGERTVL